LPVPERIAGFGLTAEMLGPQRLRTAAAATGEGSSKAA
jgi:D-arginine dehydrogenase